MSASQMPPMPKLPGYSFHDPTKTNFHKSQLFALKSGSQTESTKPLEENIATETIQNIRSTGTPPPEYLGERRPVVTPQNKAIPRLPPKWLKYDRHVLRFFGYFQEAVHENPSENFRVRKCVINHYLDDDTTYISEPRVENSGIPQGVFVKKHRIPKGDGSHYTWEDFGIRVNMNFYGRVFRVVDADEFTRNFYADQGVDLPRAESYPDDNFDKTRLMVNFKQMPEDAGEVKEYNEVKLGRGHPNKNLRSFLDNDRKVLSFDVIWEDNSYDGGVKFFKINYYLSDNTMEVQELRQVNSGTDNFAMLLKRMKLPKEPILTPCPALSLRKEEYYQPADLVLGKTVRVYGRDIMIYDCDPFTKEWYRQNLGIEMTPIPIRRPKPFLPSNPIPAHNGYGTEEDSLGNVLKLRPNAPKLDMYKMFDNDQHVLRFVSKIVSNNSEDDIRSFIVSFFPSDDTVKVFEKVERNSGIVGGKFLERRKFKNPYTNQYYTDRDFYIGNTVMLQGYRFFLCSGDEYTNTYIEQRPNVYPQGSAAYVMSKIANKGSNRQRLLVQLLVALGTDEKLVQFKDFLAALEKVGLQLTYQEEFALLRRWDKGEYRIDMEQVYNDLKNAAQVIHHGQLQSENVMSCLFGKIQSVGKHSLDS